MNKFTITAAVLAVLPLATPAHALDYFLKIDSVEGESADAKHKNEIDLLSWSWGVSTTGSNIGGGAGASRPVFAPFSWEQKLDKSFVPLFMGVANGKHFKDAQLTARRSSGGVQQEFFKIKFRDVQIVSLTSQAFVDVIHVNAEMTYDWIEMTYAPKKADGTLGDEVKGQWNLKLDKASFSGDPTVMLGLAEAGGALAFIGQVPEPGTWASLAAGLMVVGAVARRRRPPPAQAARDGG